MDHIVVAGHVCVDLTPHVRGSLSIAPGSLTDIGPLDIRLGGCVGNTARALSALGDEITIHATVGDDLLGGVVSDQLGALPGVTGQLEVRSDSSTSFSIVAESATHDRAFWHNTGANDAFDGSDIDSTTASIVHLGYPPLLPLTYANDGHLLASLLAQLRVGGATTSLDLAVVDRGSRAGTADWNDILRRIAPLVDVVTPSADDLRSALELPEARADELADRLLGWGYGTVFVSDGARGMVVACGSESRLRDAGRALGPVAEAWSDTRMTIPAEPVTRAVTTNGAGDVASSGIIHALAQGFAPEQAGLFAAALAAAHIEGRSLSAVPQPTQSEEPRWS